MTKRYYTVALKLIGIIIIFTKKKTKYKSAFYFSQNYVKIILKKMSFITCFR